MENEALSENSDAVSILYEEEPFQNIFAKGKHEFKPGTSKQPRTNHDSHKESLPHHTLPKMQFPTFDGSNPRIWIDRCDNYFNIYSISENLQVPAAVMHLEGNAAKWWQAYKQNHTVSTWKNFCQVVQAKFGADDFRTAINELLTLKQTGHCSLTLPCTIVTMMNSLHQSMLKGSRRRLRPLQSLMSLSQWIEQQ